MRKWTLIAVCAILLTVMAAFVVDAGINKLQPQKPHILFVPKTTGSQVEFWEVMRQGVNTAAEEFDVEVQVAGTLTESDIDGQIALLEQAIKDKPQVIILAATDYNRIVPVAKRIVAAGINLITVDSGLKDGISSSFIATDNYAAGQKAGQLLIDSIDQSELGPVAILNFVRGSATAMERERGVRESLAGYSDIQVLDTLYSDASEEQAYELTVELLRKEPTLRGIAALNEPSAVGAARAIKEKQAVSRVKLIGFDSSMEEIAYLEEDVLHATIVQKPFNMGYLAVKAAMDLSADKKVEPMIDTGSEVITKQNMYDSDKQKLLFPFVEK
ncbi:substrate-binding domain-containing protein [Paenibacillus prosopidis]|uniref:Monosaccharide ABC transporter substrate-binding protein (CUT2 family) n=1 Tax=Paenibacillus prosopidis TaxID=630520 RepID=A0A368W2L8_9BACL|nr:substrate-binding domain-containing protein [Paenibacillus prosopidis]RCW48950.1 monosaccharide ABC transporter substrate-binding protein (CUT2 family) [Paenibacillus prosopidis]